VRRGTRHGPKIGCVRTYHLSCRLPESYRNAVRRADTREALLVQVVAENGVEGWGECLGPPTVLQAAVQSVLTPCLLGEDAYQTDRLWHRMWQSIFRWERRGLLIAALSGLDMALWDLKGHALKRPMSEMMGGRVRDRIPCYATGLYFRDVPETDLIPMLIEEAQGYTEAGYRGVKAQLGRNRSWDMALIRALRHTLPDAVLMADAANAYDLPEAIEVGRVLHDEGYHWFEDALPMEFPEQYRLLSERASVPLAAGEWEQTRWGFQSLLSSGAVSHAQLNISYCGGPTEAMRIRAIAASQGIHLAPTGMGTMLNLAAAVHFLASDNPQPGRIDSAPGWLGRIGLPDPLRDGLLFSTPVDLDDGIARVPNGPGLGVVVDREELKTFCIRTQELSV
jgi:D-galactarolactone cycloisomerase